MSALGAVRAARAGALLRAALATTVALGAVACGPARVSLEVLFPSVDDQLRTGSVHVWILDAGGAGASTTCTALVVGDADPYDPLARRLADEVFVLPTVDLPRIDGVALGPALVYVEAVDRGGAVILAGCVAARVRGSSTISVRLWAAGAFDCADPATPPGAPCDDGLACTTGEACAGGACAGATPVDCAFLADECNAAACDEVAGGCVATPRPDCTACNDGLACVEMETCQAGYCLGASRDCSMLDDACNQGVCDEALDLCVADPWFDGFSCDDGLYCTQFDECTAGACGGGSPRWCGFLDDDCNAGTCDEGLDTCVQTPLSDGTACNDFDSCTAGDACAAGTCAGAPIDGDGDGYSPAPCDFPADCLDSNPAVSPGDPEGPMGNPTCSDGLDNDCDGSTDLADSAC